MRLIKKGNKTPSRTVVWMVEKNGKVVIKREQLTCYDSSIDEIKGLILAEYKEK